MNLNIFNKELDTFGQVYFSVFEESYLLFRVFDSTHN
jgi:hypothetical protein